MQLVRSASDGSTRRTRESHVGADFDGKQTTGSDDELTKTRSTTMATQGLQKRLLAVFLVFTLVTLSNAVLKDEEASLVGLSVRVSGCTFVQCFFP